MKRIVAGLALVLLSAGSLFAQNPDAVVFTGGDVHITGSGNGLAFPDGTVQTSATSQGPAGPANTLAIGTVATGASGSQAGASITGTSPNQVLNLTIPQGPAGTSPGVVILTPSKNLKLGETMQLTATSLDSGNNLLSSGSYNWTSLSPTVATVNSSGLVTAGAAGSAIITVRDTVHNVSGQLPIIIKSLTGDWVSSGAIEPVPPCATPSLCSLHYAESANGAVTVSTNSCTDGCTGYVFNITGNAQRNNSSISFTGTITITSGGTTLASSSMNCLNTWDGSNSVNSSCIIPGIQNGIYVNSFAYFSNYVRN